MEANISLGDANAAIPNIRFVHNALADAELGYYVLREADWNLTGA
jgi:hypothetical protein